jgi:hypothetical protein
MPSPDVFFRLMNFHPGNCRRRDAASAALRLFAALLTAFALIAIGSPAAAQSGDSARIHWKYLEMAQVKLDDKTPLKWNVYQPDKKDKKDKKRDSQLVLVLLGHRYLMLDLQTRRVYVVPLTELQAQGADFESGDLARPDRVIPSSDWTDRDVGPAELIHLTLGDYGRVLQVSLPHMPDLRPFY